jgi:hypothetical protein
LLNATVELAHIARILAMLILESGQANSKILVKPISFEIISSLQILYLLKLILIYQLAK